ncbi:MAG: UbiA family prenyltransferase [Nocardioidaceae bacterium]
MPTSPDPGQGPEPAPKAASGAPAARPGPSAARRAAQPAGPHRTPKPTSSKDPIETNAKTPTSATTKSTPAVAGAPRPTNVTKAQIRRNVEHGVKQPTGRILLGLLHASHPKQALGIGLGVAVFALIYGRPAREALAAGLAVLLTQVALGMINDLADQDQDAAAQVPNKALADGILSPGTVKFALFLVLMVSVPASLQNGLPSATLLAISLVVGVIHNRVLKNGPLSFVGWCITFALLVPFVTFGMWGMGTQPLAFDFPAAKTPSFLALLAAATLGLAIHLATAIPHLAHDKHSESNTLPALIASRLGSRGLVFLASTLASISTVALIWVAL